MTPQEVRSLGGKVMAARQRAEAIAHYRQHPRICRGCGATILVREGEKVKDIRQRKFCSRKCAATFHNQTREYRRSTKLCQSCRKAPATRRECGAWNKLCVACREAERRRLAALRVADVSRHGICGHARSVLLKAEPELRCKGCGYDKHVECCHLKAVASFPQDALVAEVNDPSNLAWLCPNCHWELDHGLTKGGIEKAVNSLV